MISWALFSILLSQQVPARDWERLTAAEDARAATAAQLQSILSYSHSKDAELRRLAVRALGRLERPDLSDSIAKALHDPVPAIRAQAAWSIAQANMPNRAPTPVRDSILATINREKNPQVRAALAETLGRLRPADVVAARHAASVLASMTSEDPTVRLGAMRGLYFILRQGPQLRVALDTAKSALLQVATSRTGNDTTSVRSRTMAAQIVTVMRMTNDSVTALLLADPTWAVRRVALPLAKTPPLHDQFWRVRFDALRLPQARGLSCDSIIPLTRDENQHVRIQAIDNLGTTCALTESTLPRLESITRTLSSSNWHEAAHAIVSLASRARGSVQLLPFVNHENYYVRSYAAVATGIIADTTTLRRLARDAHPNVRTAAITALSRLMKHDADSIYLAQLSSDDNQLLMTAATVLDSTKTSEVVPALLDALDRISAFRIENYRDARDAFLKTIGNLGDASFTRRLIPYLRDYDPAIAALTSEILGKWTGQPHPPDAQPLPLVPTPSYAEALQIAKSMLRMEMANGDVVEIRLLPFDAPTNAARFYRMAREGYFNGLTLHRVEPNFVVQGGSPNANEYKGAPRFSRDELGVPNYRATIGLSTRGHDTGDAQIFINTVDNVLLDPLYTVFAVVSSGMDSVDRMLEGATIKRIVIN